ncbi:MAG: hypothetical protein KatS3mg089_0882 [Patescibacteria group bacterium]|nr:MAG: hypothetical protein KatS3mg089_0882 [Patescibacteria group bacterium]
MKNKSSSDHKPIIQSEKSNNTDNGWKIKRYFLVSVITIIILGLLVTAVYFYYKYTQTKNLLAGSVVSNEVQQLLSKVGRHIDLPTGEVPIPATVSDVTQLSGNKLFARAKNGDRVLIYTRAKKAILYRPEIDKIIEVGPVDVDNSVNTQVAGAATSSQPLKIALYNGTTTVGLTKRVEASLLKISSLNAEVIAKENASKDNYADSIVVDLTGKNSNAAKQLATYVKGAVGSLPKEEIKPEGADILIILGKSYVALNPTPAAVNTPTPSE